MYPRDESKYEKLYPNYILLVKNDIHYKCIVGSIYLYKDNDGRGVYDFGLCNVNLFENEFHNIDDACDFYFAKFPHHYCFIEINIKPLIYDIDNPVFICDKYKYKIKQKLINLFKSFINIK